MLRVWLAFLGLYLACGYFLMVPYVLELYGDQGFARQLFFQPGGAVFFLEPLGLKNLYAFGDFVAPAMNALGILSGLLLCFGFQTRWVAAVALIVSIYFYYLSGYNIPPEWPLVNWMLAALVLFPKDSFRAHQDDEAIDFSSRMLRVGAWLAMGFAYLGPGVSKLRSSAWQSGRALEEVILFDAKLRPVLRGFLIDVIDLSPFILKPATFGIVFLEVTCCVFTIFRSTRWIAWSMLVLMNIFILIVFNLTHVSLGMLLFHGLFIVLYGIPKSRYV